MSQLRRDRYNQAVHGQIWNCTRHSSLLAGNLQRRLHAIGMQRETQRSTGSYRFMLDPCTSDLSQCLMVAARTHGTALETDKYEQDSFSTHARENAARQPPNQSAISAKLIPAFLCCKLAVDSDFEGNQHSKLTCKIAGHRAATINSIGHQKICQDRYQNQNRYAQLEINQATALFDRSKD